MTDFDFQKLETELGVAVSERRRVRLAEIGVPSDREVALELLTNGQTYFYRHREQCEAFRRLLKRRPLPRPYRILSAGCSTGCEPYTIALLLESVGREGEVVGTDIHPGRLAMARRGIFPKSRMNRVPANELETYFTPVNSGHYSASDALRRRITFVEENLSNPEASLFQESWDAIFCRNVLIYFREDRARDLMDRLVESLQVGGALILGFPEAFYGLRHPGLKMLASKKAIFQKAQARIDAAPPPSEPLMFLGEETFLAGVTLHAQGRLAESEAQLMVSREQQPRFCLVHYFLARLYDEKREPDRARQSLEEFFNTYDSRDPLLVLFLAKHGLTHEQLLLAGQRLSARLSVRRVTNDDPVGIPRGSV